MKFHIPLSLGLHSSAEIGFFIRGSLAAIFGGIKMRGSKPLVDRETNSSEVTVAIMIGCKSF